MNIPQGNPHSADFNRCDTREITSKELDLAVAQGVADNPEIYKYPGEPMPPKEILDYRLLPDGKGGKEDVSPSFWSQGPVLEYYAKLNKINAHKFWLVYYHGVLEGDAARQQSLRDRLKPYGVFIRQEDGEKPPMSQEDLDRIDQATDIFGGGII